MDSSWALYLPVKLHCSRWFEQLKFPTVQMLLIDLPIACKKNKKFFISLSHEFLALPPEICVSTWEVFLEW